LQSRRFQPWNNPDRRTQERPARINRDCLVSNLGTTLIGGHLRGPWRIAHVLEFPTLEQP